MTNPPILPPTGGDRDSWQAGDPLTPRRDRGALAALGVGAIAIVTVAALFTAAQPAQPTEASVSEILRRPAAFDGDRVASTGDIDEFLTDRSFVIGSVVDRDHGLLVLIRPSALVIGYPASRSVPAPVSQLLTADDEVALHGTVDMFDGSEMSEQLGMVLHPRLFASWEGQPSIVVDRVDLTQPSERPA